MNRKNNGQNNCIQELSWETARSDVLQVDRALARIIDKISPDKQHTLIKLTYSFGDVLIQNGTLHLPSENGNLFPITTDAKITKSLKNKLNYAAIPLLLTLKNCNEVFVDTGTRVIPLNLFYPGSLLGLFETTDFIFNRYSKPKWCVSAGARSLFMLPKINENGGLKRLRSHYKISSDLHHLTLSDHWKIFKEIAGHSAFTQPWKNEILIFSKQWLSHINDPVWTEFNYYLLRNTWQQAQFAISKIEFGLLWESFSDVIASKRMKPSPYLADQVKHTMLIATSKWPGFRVADNSQRAAPTEGLQKAFLEVYSLKHYFPTIMHASLFDLLPDLPIYYSLSFPTLLEGSPHNSNSCTIMLDLHNIKILLDTLVNIAATKFCDIMLNKEFSYFHVEDDKHGEISSSKLIPQLDSSFLHDNKEKKFCSSSSFWRGCIKISK